MELRQLTYFRAIVRTGSFSRASAEIAVAQPALSRQVRQLEAELGVQLLYRNGRGVSLTDAGREFLHGIEAILEDLDALRGRLATAREVPQGSVLLGTPPAVSAVLAAPLLQRIARTWPDLHVRVVDGFSGYLHEWVIAGRVDLAILYSARATRSLVTRHLMAEDLFLIAPAADRRLPAAGPDGVLPLRRVARLPLLLPGQDHAMRRAIDRAAAAAGLRLRVELEIDALHALKELVIGGSGYSILPFGGIHAEVAAGLLQAWRLAEPEVTNDMILAMSNRRPVTLAMREIARLIGEEIAGLVARGRLKGRL